MARSVYVASVEGHTAKSVLALGMVQALKGSNLSVGVFRAVTPDAANDHVLKLLLSQLGEEISYEDSIGVSYKEVHESPERALSKIVSRYRAQAKKFDAMVVIGSDYKDVVGTTELSFNAKVAANIAAPVVMVLSGRQAYSSSEHLGQAAARSVDELSQMAELSLAEMKSENVKLLAIAVNRAEPEDTQKIHDAVKSLVAPETPVWVLPEDKLLVAPRLRQIQEAVDGKLLFGEPARLETETLDVVVAAMSAEHVLERLKDRAVVVTPGDRTDVIVPLVMADQAETFPTLAGIILNGGFELPEEIQKLIKGMNASIPIISCNLGSFDTTMQVVKTRALLTADDKVKLARATGLLTKSVDLLQVARTIEAAEVTTVTPLMFELDLIERASKAKKKIVLPEGADDRILQAASEVLQKNIADLIILGDPKDIQKRSKELGLDLAGAELMDVASSKHFDACVSEYVKLRSHKGVTQEQAKQKMLDSSYFGTMLVQLGIADGMVSGAMNTTAHTIRPAFEFVKTKEGVSSVSSVFLMALKDRVVVYGDCAVIPEPTEEQLADIAISSAETAKAFGIEPRVAMLSYSTGESGSGAEVDKVRNATELVKKRAPTLSVEGPIQYDAAVDAAVAKAKLPGSSVAGQATVFVFPDLNTGNNTYKAVQRTSGALAIGPVLQGLRKPVNDLSRGALVPDIVNTIAITAIQAAEL
uniref:Phosphate acetyltransferase n=1 Tax=uncultured Micrococcales bacterium TaxID=1920814 RepID=A0A871Y7K2_9MICO|nr:Phosphate acetyltransferase [uncultured Micrococcales bacterium]